MVDLVQEKIDKIEKDPAPDAKEADNFKAASIKYFKFIRNVYSEYIKLGKANNSDERMAVYRDIEKAVSERAKVISDMQAVQKKYAGANGFRME